MEFFVVRRNFSLSRGRNPQKNFERGEVCSYQTLNGVENTGLGETQQEVLSCLAHSHITIVKTAHELVKSVLLHRLGAK